jgi:hypothetical protein
MQKEVGRMAKRCRNGIATGDLMTSNALKIAMGEA